MKIKKDIFLSPAGIFIIYLLASSFLIMGFRLIFPSEPAPLENFSFRWRLLEGVADIIALFPALAMSGLVVPLGLRNIGTKELARFSPHFLKRLKGTIITAICAVGIYSILFFLALPLTENYRTHIRFEGYLFRLAKDRAAGHLAAEEWPEASRFISICERIWPDSPEMEYIRTETTIYMEELRISRAESWARERYRPADEEGSLYGGIPGEREPVNTAEALSMADEALREERYYDAHWLATLAERLARPGSADAAGAARLASQAWNAVSSLEPNSRELSAYNLYRQKRRGYEAMIAGEWIQAYYIFTGLYDSIPGDPDVANFLEVCEEGIAQVAFFIDEMELTLGEILTGAVFSLPIRSSGSRNGRMVLRINSLSTLSDYSYGIGVEILAFNNQGLLLYHVEAPYAKFVPITVEEEPRLVLMMRVLDRGNPERRWEPVWTGPERSDIGDTQIMLDLAYEDFLLLVKAEGGMDKLLVDDLLVAEQKLGAYGHVPQVFQAEIIYRVSEPAFFLPMSILSIIIGWRYRARRRPRYTSYLMLALLPLVFNGIVHLYRSYLNTLAIWLVISFGFPQALLLFGVGIFVIFVLMFVGLAAQHG
jgi:hypothetical protein